MLCKNVFFVNIWLTTEWMTNWASVIFLWSVQHVKYELYCAKIIYSLSKGGSIIGWNDDNDYGMKCVLMQGYFFKVKTIPKTWTWKTSERIVMGFSLVCQSEYEFGKKFKVGLWRRCMRPCDSLFQLVQMLNLFFLSIFLTPLVTHHIIHHHIMDLF